MGPEMVFCFLLPLGPGLRLLAVFLLLLHLLLLLLPFFHEGTRECVLPLSLICSTYSDQNFHALSSTISNASCTPAQIFLVKLIYLPSFEVFNLHFFCSQLLILVYGWSRRSLLLHTLFLHLILATVILTVGVLFCLRIHSLHGPLLLLTLVHRCHYL